MNEPAQLPEADLIERLRTAARPKLSVRAAAKAAGISDSRWRQIIKGYRQETKDVRVPAHAPDDTLARMARAVGATPGDLREVGREDAAVELEVLIERDRVGRQAQQNRRPDRTPEQGVRDFWAVHAHPDLPDLRPLSPETVHRLLTTARNARDTVRDAVNAEPTREVIAQLGIAAEAVASSADIAAIESFGGAYEFSRSVPALKQYIEKGAPHDTPAHPPTPPGAPGKAGEDEKSARSPDDPEGWGGLDSGGDWPEDGDQGENLA